MKKLLQNKKGFTLVEVIVVLVILGILAAIAVPSMTGYIDKARTQEDIANARVGYMAAQTIASENYSKNISTAPTWPEIEDLSGGTFPISGNSGAVQSNDNITVVNGKIATYKYIGKEVNIELKDGTLEVKEK